MKRVLFAFFLLLPLCAGAQLIPMPQSVSFGSGTMSWNSPARLVIDAKDSGSALLREYAASLPDTLFFSGRGKASTTVRLVQKKLADSTGKEAYELRISPGEARITANTSAGLFYGLQTLLQLKEDSSGGIPCLAIRDEPCFAYRGFMLDVSRHFFPKEFIFKQIDILSSLKVNVLHLHLVDTGGWRIQLDRYPQLTEQAAFRTDCNWKEWERNGMKFCPEGENSYGGFYSKEDIRNIVHYAAVHQMEVIPEIDMPGHSSEVLGVMPELLCQGDANSKAYEMCIGSEKTYRFCENVLDEVFELFPSKYIHIGGDECGTGNWSKCPLCQAMMKREGVTDIKHLQACFTRRIEEYAASRGKTIVGWDELLDGEISPSATIMSWREDPAGWSRIVSSGHPVVIASESNFYLDYYQDYPCVEPLCFAGYTPLRKTYGIRPFDGLEGDRSLVLGLQCNLWTEAVETEEHAEHMMYPRVAAMVEKAWTGEKANDYEEFKSRVAEFQDKLVARGCHPFDIRNEFGPRPGSNVDVKALSTGKRVAFATPWSDNFSALGETSLTDGKLADWGMNGLRWMGFDAFMDVTVDLEEVMDITSVKTSFNQNAFTSMYMPEEYEILISDDGRRFTSLYSLKYPSDRNLRYCIEDLGWSGKARARYVRIKASHPSGWCWLMCDEIIVM